MATNRLEALKQMVAQDPANSFARYGLAMELSNSNMLQEAIEEFKTLMGKDGTYVAAFYHCGQALEKLGDLDQARSIYQRGIDASVKKGDPHTQAEIEAALSLLPV